MYIRARSQRRCRLKICTRRVFVIADHKWHMYLYSTMCDGRASMYICTSSLDYIPEYRVWRSCFRKKISDSLVLILAIHILLSYVMLIIVLAVVPLCVRIPLLSMVRSSARRPPRICGAVRHTQWLSLVAQTAELVVVRWSGNDLYLPKHVWFSETNLWHLQSSFL